jgi:hypothetical protein
MDKKPYIIPYQLLQFGLEFILLKIHLWLISTNLIVPIMAFHGIHFN